MVRLYIVTNAVDIERDMYAKFEPTGFGYLLL